MDLQLTLIVGGGLVILVSYITCLIGKRKSPKIIKYIPAIASAVGIGLLYLKLHYNIYVSHAFEGIYDMLGIILLSITFLISLIVAIVIEINNKRKSNLQN